MIRCLFIIIAFVISQASAFELPAGSTQCIVGIAKDQHSSHVTLGLYEKSRGGWKQVGEAWSGRLGKNGLAWGRGLHPAPPEVIRKKEGDNRSPAGVFQIGGAWGYAKSIRKHPALPYRQVTSRDLWIEDPDSPEYNCNVILDREPTTAAEKKQQMKQTDPVHALKLFIAHNAAPGIVPGAGSSIFFHIWRNDGGRATAGCTTMAQPKLEWMISKIDPTRRPLYILLTQADYEKYRNAWKLP